MLLHHWSSSPFSCICIFSFTYISGNGYNFPHHYTAPDDKQSTNSFESAEDFERRIFGDSAGNRPSPNSFFRKLDDAEKSYDRSGLGSTFSSGNRSSILDGLDESFNTLSDGMDGKLKEAASYFQVDPEEVGKEDYAYRADMTFWPGNTYELKVWLMSYHFLYAFSILSFNSIRRYVSLWFLYILHPLVFQQLPSNIQLFGPARMYTL